MAVKETCQVQAPKKEKGNGSPQQEPFEWGDANHAGALTEGLERALEFGLLVIVVGRLLLRDGRLALYV